MYPYTIHLPDLKTEKITLGNKCRLKNFYRIGDGVYRSDQPSAACFRELEKFGMREILNLRCYHTDTKEAQGTSLILHHLPTRATLLRLDDLVTAMQIIRDRKGPLLFHCWHGSDRTGAVAAMYRMVFQHVPKQHAIDEHHRHHRRSRYRTYPARIILISPEPTDIFIQLAVKRMSGQRHRFAQNQ